MVLSDILEILHIYSDTELMITMLGIDCFISSICEIFININ